MKRKTITIFMALMLVSLFGCATFEKQITRRDIASWANSIYIAQYDDYLTWFNQQPDGSYVLKPGTPEKQRVVLVRKKEIFVELQPLLLIYSAYVESGITPVGVIIAGVEARMIALVNDLIKEGAK